MSDKDRIMELLHTEDASIIAKCSDEECLQVVKFHMRFNAPFAVAFLRPSFDRQELIKSGYLFFVEGVGKNGKTTYLCTIHHAKSFLPDWERCNPVKDLEIGLSYL